MIRHDASQIPAGLTESKYVLLHDLDYNPATKNYEQIKRRCSSSNPRPVSTTSRSSPTATS